MVLIFKGCIFRWHKAGIDDIALRQWDCNICAMVFTLLYLAKTKKVITEELRQHVFSDGKDRLLYSFMIFIEENSVSWEPVELHKNTAPTNTQNNTPTVVVLNNSKNGTDKSVSKTVATYSRFCVQKKSSPDPGEVYIVFATSQNTPSHCRGCFKPQPLSCSAL
jgi:hypothetical protein